MVGKSHLKIKLLKRRWWWSRWRFPQAHFVKHIAFKPSWKQCCLICDLFTRNSTHTTIYRFRRILVFVICVWSSHVYIYYYYYYNNGYFFPLFWSNMWRVMKAVPTNVEVWLERRIFIAIKFTYFLSLSLSLSWRCFLIVFTCMPACMHSTYALRMLG